MKAEDELVLDHLKVYFTSERKLSEVFSRKPPQVVRAVDDVTMTCARNEVLGLVGETGCGKSTIAKTILRMNEITSGGISYQGQEIHRLRGEQLKNYFEKVQIIWQDPASSLNPRMKVREILSRPLVRFRRMSRTEVIDRVRSITKVVGINDKEIDHYPHEFSGGGKQRIVIARALIIEPEFIIADEPTSSLDVSIQAQVLNLLKGLKDKLSLTMLYISHDLSTISFMSSRVAIMYFGRIVEILPNKDLLRNNHHWYTRKLLEAIPKGKRLVNTEVPAESATALNHEGCIYSSRCPNARELCKTVRPLLREIDAGSYVACHFPIDNPK
jgi:peptide/nickel transport system ATP-binding protein